MNLIDKDAVIEEINRQYNYLRNHSGTYGAGFILGFRQASWQIIDFCNSLQSKEAVLLTPQKSTGSEDVDLDEEIEKCLKSNSMLAVSKKDFTNIAKHFYLLGLAQKGE